MKIKKMYWEEEHQFVINGVSFRSYRIIYPDGYREVMVSRHNGYRWVRQHNWYGRK